MIKVNKPGKSGRVFSQSVVLLRSVRRVAVTSCVRTPVCDCMCVAVSPEKLPPTGCTGDGCRNRCSIRLPEVVLV